MFKPNMRYIFKIGERVLVEHIIQPGLPDFVGKRGVVQAINNSHYLVKLDDDSYSRRFYEEELLMDCSQDIPLMLTPVPVANMTLKEYWNQQYSLVRCSDCQKTFQFIDFGKSAHYFQCTISK